VSAGLQITQADINSAAAGLSQRAFSVFADIQHFKTWLDGLSSTDLVNNYGFVLGDANILKSALTDLGDLAGVFNNSASAYLTGTHDYRAFAKQLLGVGLY
jgi:hypothetical protein